MVKYHEKKELHIMGFIDQKKTYDKVLRNLIW